ncbi:peptidoglycan DD-metalloendopeptidase family protein [Cryobacterium sp. SO2]|uniref:peptidoglycan DD-metalloendopeptidase family protein n=1 Tax=Cryobacterium sp. SO2 TaxID=1897060 RepID=UPI00223D6337|nr:peptidoglycan DD-metalloendopeptidase family protein [Cryobacterium sp. SO2]WEO77737.1 peptidoglycan DD-metalloendopeptidase family protein [Cryobacterium sp. SO2]
MLTRRELRDLERRAATPAAEPSPAAAHHGAHTDDAFEFPAAELSAEAQVLVGAELAEPHLEPVVIKAPDLALPAEPAYEQLTSDVSPNTTTTTIVLPSRAALRAQLRAEQASTEAPAPLAPVEAAAPRTTPAEPERVLPAYVPRTRARTGTANRAPVSVRSGHHRMRLLATKGGSIVAMSIVALMAVATSLPADALLSSSDVRAAALEAQKPASSEPAQTIDLANGTDTITVEQDSYQAKSIAEVAAASGIRLEDSFTNNPNGTIQWPFAVGVHIGDQFGYRNCAGCSVNHGGQDFNPGVGAPIQAIADGVVSFTEDGEGSLGVHMVIDHMIDGELVSSVYAHMIHGSMLLKTGDVVKVGQVIGQVGTTGMSTGPHLHFEIRIGGIKGTKVDPLVWLYANTN